MQALWDQNRYALSSSRYLALGLPLTLNQLFTYSFAYTEFSGSIKLWSYLPRLPKPCSLLRESDTLARSYLAVWQVQRSVLHWEIQEVNRGYTAHSRGGHSVQGSHFLLGAYWAENKKISKPRRGLQKQGQREVSRLKGLPTQRLQSQTQLCGVCGRYRLVILLENKGHDETGVLRKGGDIIQHV